MGNEKGDDNTSTESITLTLSPRANEKEIPKAVGTTTSLAPTTTATTVVTTMEVEHTGSSLSQVSLKNRDETRPDSNDIRENKQGKDEAYTEKASSRNSSHNSSRNSSGKNSDKSSSPSQSNEVESQTTHESEAPCVSVVVTNEDEDYRVSIDDNEVKEDSHSEKSSSSSGEEREYSSNEEEHEVVSQKEEEAPTSSPFGNVDSNSKLTNMVDSFNEDQQKPSAEDLRPPPGLVVNTAATPTMGGITTSTPTNSGLNELLGPPSHQASPWNLNLNATSPLNDSNNGLSIATPSDNFLQSGFDLLSDNNTEAVENNSTSMYGGFNLDLNLDLSTNTNGVNNEDDDDIFNVNGLGEGGLSPLGNLPSLNLFENNKDEDLGMNIDISSMDISSIIGGQESMKPPAGLNSTNFMNHAHTSPMANSNVSSFLSQAVQPETLTIILTCTVSFMNSSSITSVKLCSPSFQQPLPMIGSEMDNKLWGVNVTIPFNEPIF